MDLKEFNDYLLLNLDSKKTQIQYLYRVKQFFIKYSEFNQSNVNSYLAELLNRNVKASTFNGHVATLKHYARFKKIFVDFPKQKKILKNLKKDYITLKELEHEILPYFDLMFDTEVIKRKLIVRFMFVTGLRKEEVINARKKDFNFDECTLYVWNGKGQKPRITILPKEIHEDLKKEFEKHINEESAFCINMNYINYIFDEINNNLNYKKHLHPHIMRRSFINYCYNSGISKDGIKILTGHKEMKTLEEYLVLDENKLIEESLKKFKFQKGGKIH